MEGHTTYDSDMKFHSYDDKPSIVYSSGTKIWHKNGMIHRLNGPACIFIDGDEYYYQNDKLHRIGGPASINPKTGYKEWWVDGKLIWTNEILSVFTLMSLSVWKDLIRYWRRSRRYKRNILLADHVFFGSAWEILNEDNVIRRNDQTGVISWLCAIGKNHRGWEDVPRKYIGKRVSDILDDDPNGGERIFRRTWYDRIPD